MIRIKYYRLNKLKPTLLSTVLKLNEEIGELNREVIKFYPYTEKIKNKPELDGAKENIKKTFDHILEELLDVGQVCATLLFVIRDTSEVSIQDAFDNHMEKLRRKNYIMDGTCHENRSSCIEISDSGENSISMILPRLDIKPNIISTCLKIGEEAGELSQFVGKKQGMSGEKKFGENESLNMGVLEELLDVAQCCTTMLYIFHEQYGIDVDALMEKHYRKLEEHGYLSKE